MNEIGQIGRIVRELRKEYGLSQMSLGEAIGWKQPAICAFERGRRKRLDIADVKKLANALEIPSQRLLYTLDQEATIEIAANSDPITYLAEQLNHLSPWQQERVLTAIAEITSAIKGKTPNDNN
jgi:transcriptional regulator with XRE-family HTH domain